MPYSPHHLQRRKWGEDRKRGEEEKWQEMGGEERAAGNKRD